MKSKLVIITALASIASTGLPLQAQRTQTMNRLEILSHITVAQCYINKGRATEERGDEILDETVQEFPYLKTAYQWAINSDNARAAVKAMVPYLGGNCTDDVTGEVIENVLMPYLN